MVMGHSRTTTRTARSTYPETTDRTDTMTGKRFRAALASVFHEYAERKRREVAEYRDRWEADTEPGYPMTGLYGAGCALGLALADLADAIAAGIEPRGTSPLTPHNEKVPPPSRFKP